MKSNPIEAALRTYVTDPDLWPWASYYLDAPGKGIRWRLSQELGEKWGTPKEKSKRIGEVAELLHLASLIHDDIVDGADKRRGKTPLHLATEVHQAVLTGDLLIAIAFSLAVRHLQIASLRFLEKAVYQLVWGELKETVVRQKPLPPYEVVTLIRGKTGSLFAWVCAATAVESPQKALSPEKAWELGEVLGEVYQLMDDIHDRLGTDPTKSAHQDLKSGIPSLLETLSPQEVENFYREREKRLKPLAPTPIVEEIKQRAQELVHAWLRLSQGPA